VSLRNISSHWLQNVFEVNASLWGGVFNFIISPFKRIPERYREEYQTPFPRNHALRGSLRHTINGWMRNTGKGAARWAARNAASEKELRSNVTGAPNLHGLSRTSFLPFPQLYAP
jgi:hypothetical protein